MLRPSITNEQASSFWLSVKDSHVAATASSGVAGAEEAHATSAQASPLRTSSRPPTHLSPRCAMHGGYPTVPNVAHAEFQRTTTYAGGIAMCDVRTSSWSLSRPPMRLSSMRSARVPPMKGTETFVRPVKV